MKVQVDETLCIGCALCVSMCETIFSINEDGICEATPSDLSDTLAADIEEVQECCPVEAIVID